MTKATPEPWKVDRDPMGALIISGPEGETVFYTGTMDEDCANADLVVDARKTAAERDRLKELNAELLGVLKEALTSISPPSSMSMHYWGKQLTDTSLKLKAAIAKSEEESQ